MHPAKRRRLEMPQGPHDFQPRQNESSRPVSQLPTLSSLLQAQRTQGSSPSVHALRVPLETMAEITPITLRRVKTDESIASSSSSTSSTSSSPERRVPKTSRYLREMDRRTILQRIKNGEKQSVLAKEYHVSRAAICNLNKHRDLVLSRSDENPMAKHPKKPRFKAKPIPVEPPKATSTVYELDSRPVVVLRSRLQQQETSDRDFRRYTERLMRLVLEETLALASMRRDNSDAEYPPCVITLSDQAESSIMTEGFRAIEPLRPVGTIQFKDSSEMDVSIPPGLAQHSVLLLAPTAFSGERLCHAIKYILTRPGASQQRLSVVTLGMTQQALALIRAKYPGVSIVTAQVGNVDLLQSRLQQVLPRSS
ncbi:hypothetical protein Poli38472_010787 [Pythium oligandrum]|uniref:Phosphoribosyltransferase domain-containing protein n=1 Tax=Pythium oligandrum TaxID=41045 RepID=A0A8K1FI54_PYTOL|nr:hypothetical protein Poli38472_010787 [Pythium oligandrum]|eukprot:TMW61724.1 hypothetical protein Poli38472_010787 [Pythium oligandrum]